MLRFLEVSKAYREGLQRRSVLQRASLTVPRGAFCALRGPSGSGKSTLLNLAAGLDRADSGQIWCEEVEVSRLNEYQAALFRRRNLGFVFQFFHLFPTLTVAENLRLSLELAGSQQRHVEPWLERIGLLDRAGSFPDVLSGGEQQRVAVARALVHRPKLILADEPTGNLDEANGSNILQLLREVCREQETTLLVATHSPEVAGAADMVVNIRAGQFVLEGA